MYVKTSSRQFSKLFSILILLCLLALNLGSATGARAQTASSISVIATIPVGILPNGIAINENTNRIYVANEIDNTVSVIDGSTNSVIATVAVGSEPTGIGVNPVTNKIYVVNHSGGSPVSVIDGNTNTVIAEVPVDINAFGIAVNPNTNLIYITVQTGRRDGAYVDVIDGSSDTLVSTIPYASLDVYPNGIVVNPITNLIYVADNNNLIQVIDGNTNAPIQSITDITSWSNSFNIAINSDTNRVYIASAIVGGSAIAIIDGESNTILDRISVPSPGGNAFPFAIGVNPSTNHIFIGNNNGGVSVLDGATNTFLANALPVPGALLGFAVNRVTNRVYVTNSTDNTVVVIDDTSVPPPPPPTGVIDYFALGDSIASGHGLMDDGTPCRQSELAYPNKVVNSLHVRYETVNFKFLACSGATAKKPSSTTLAQSQNKWLRNQVDYVLANLSDRPTLVSITIGANDFEWTDSLNFYHRLAQPGASYLNWVTKTKVAVGGELRRQVKRLLAHDNVVVVITQVHNPANKESNFFDLFPGRPCASVFNDVNCYDRFSYAVGMLNTAYVLDVWVPLGRPDRVRIAQINAPTGESFSSPSPSCGTALPGQNTTLIQYVGDPNSNSLLPRPVRRLWKIGNTAGDCFHPNEQGAQVYADAVNAAAQVMDR